MRHGGDWEEIERRFPLAPRPLIDLSTGINPWPWPVGPLPAELWQRLPDAALDRRLRSAAAAAYGVSCSDLVVPAPGTQALIQWLPRLRAAAARVSVLGPTYSEHALAWRSAGHEVETVARIEDLATCADVAVLVHPNNPDGRAFPIERLLRIADALGRRGGWLVVDEAFVDADPGISLSGEAGRPGLIVLRSFGKFYGLAGLRLGFALAEPALAVALRDALGPWAVGGPASMVGAAALGDAGWAERTRTRLAGAAAAFDGRLSTHRLRVLGGTSLFRLAETPHAALLFERLAERGILARRFEAHPTWLRFGLPPDRAAAERLSEALAIGG